MPFLALKCYGCMFKGKHIVKDIVFYKPIFQFYIKKQVKTNRAASSEKLRKCANCADSNHLTHAQSHPGLCFPFIHFFNDSFSGQVKA